MFKNTMVFNTSRFRVFVYGSDKKSINEIKSNFTAYSSYGILFDDTLTERTIINYCLEQWPSTGHCLFINADTMKKVNIVGFNTVSSLISKMEDIVIDKDAYMIMFHRCNDSGINSHYVNEILNGVSVFKSFKPGNSDCFYLSDAAITILKEIPKDTDYSKKIRSFVRSGEYDCFSFNPNLYTFRLEDSDLNATIHQSKCSMLQRDESISVNDRISQYFSSHLLLFWIFFVFFICVIFVALIKVFKIGYILV